MYFRPSASVVEKTAVFWHDNAPKQLACYAKSVIKIPQGWGGWEVMGRKKWWRSCGEKEAVGEVMRRKK